MKIAQKLGLMVGSLLVAMAVLIAGLAVQTVHVTHGYNGLLSHQVAQGEEARDMQDALSQELIIFKDLLIQTDPAQVQKDLVQIQVSTAQVPALATKLLSQTDDPRLQASLRQFQSTYNAVKIIYTSAYQQLVGKQINSTQANAAVEGQDTFAKDLITIVVRQAQASLDHSVSVQQHSVNRNLRIIIGAGILLILLMALLVTLAVRSIVRPVRILTETALDAANNRLPKVVAQIATLPADAPTPTLPRFEVTTNDELAELASALTTLQDSAVGLALDQRRDEEANAETLVNLGRRNQSLLTRMLSYVTDLERDERDPEVLDNLFRLDHLTTRIRRNAESLLVLAGAKQTRTWSQPIAMDDVLRAALSEIEEYTRVTVHHMDHARVHGAVAADLTHMLAELLENGTRFSPRENQVLVVGRLTPGGYQFDLIDEGLGMPAAELRRANERIAEAGQRRPDTKVLGHHVVGRIAARRGIFVHLLPSDQVGLTAQVLVPVALLSDAVVPATLRDITPVPMITPAPAPAPQAGGRRGSSAPEPTPSYPSAPEPSYPSPSRSDYPNPSRPPAYPNQAQPAASYPDPAEPSYPSPSRTAYTHQPAASYPNQAQPAASYPNQPAAYPDQGQGASYPNHAQGASYPNQVQPASYPSQGQPASYPSQGQPASNPSQGQPASNPSQGRTPASFPGPAQPSRYARPAEPNRTPAPAKAPASTPGRRVRGAQLGELGDLGQPAAAPVPVDSDHVRAQMAALQSGVAAARREGGTTQAYGPPADDAAPVRRVRGAQLAELGDTGDVDAGVPSRDPAVIARQLASLQAANHRADRDTGRYRVNDDTPGSKG